MDGANSSPVHQSDSKQWWASVRSCILVSSATLRQNMSSSMKCSGVMGPRGCTVHAIYHLVLVGSYNDRRVAGKLTGNWEKNGVNKPSQLLFNTLFLGGGTAIGSERYLSNIEVKSQVSHIFHPGICPSIIYNTYLLRVARKFEAIPRSSGERWGYTRKVASLTVSCNLLQCKPTEEQLFTL